VPYYTGPTKFYQVAQAVHSTVEAALSNDVNRSGIVPGAIAWDDSPCGLLAVSLGTIFLSDNFPEPIEGPVGFQCDAAWEVVQVVIQVIRCAPQPATGDLAPKIEAQESTAAVMAADAAEMVKSISAWICAQRGETIVDAIMGLVEPQGPEGDSVGIQMIVNVALPRG